MSFNGRKLTKKRNGMFGGVCIGIADYLQIDVTVVRLLWAVGTLFTVGLGLLAYIAAACIMPYEE
jgi:phage shock protein PspC (stress-responsive transcriptional regulator)